MVEPGDTVTTQPLRGDSEQTEVVGVLDAEEKNGEVDFEVANTVLRVESDENGTYTAYHPDDGFEANVARYDPAEIGV